MSRVDGEAELCPHCEGRGWVVEDDGRAGTARPCACHAEELPPRLLAEACIPARYGDCSLAGFNVEVNDPEGRERLFAAQEISRRYVDEFVTDRGAFRESGLILIGPPGTGKTHLAVAVLKELITRYHVHGLFVDFTTLVHEIQSTFETGSAETKSQVLDPVMEAEVLVLDELGAQKSTPWVNDTLYLIMNTRYTRRLPTLFTTNFELEEEVLGHGLDRGPDAAKRLSLATRIPARLVSRLHEMARPVPIRVGDFRRDIKAKQFSV